MVIEKSYKGWRPNIKDDTIWQSCQRQWFNVTNRWWLHIPSFLFLFPFPIALTLSYSGWVLWQVGTWTSWAFWRRWLRWSTWQHWIRSLTRRQPQRPRRRGDRSGGGGDTESYSDGSNIATTPASIETPLASSISRGPSMNIRDPYSSTPTRYKAAAAAAVANDPRLGGVDRRRTLVASKSLTQDHHNKQMADGQMCPSPSLDPCDDADTDAAKRSHSADSVFTILIRLPADSSADKAEHKVSIRMIPANIPPAASHRPRMSASSTGSAGGGNQPAVRSRSVPVGNEQHDGYSNRSRPAGSGGGSASQYTSNRSLAARPTGSRSAQYNDSTSSLLCGTNLHLPNALSLSKLTALTKPNHLPLHKGKLKNHHASPWVPRSCMPVAQSPLIVRCTRFNGGSSGTPDSGDRTPSGTLPMDAKIVPKHRPTGIGPAGGITGSPAGSPAGALQTVSGSVANNSGMHPPIRRPNHNAYSPSAAAAAAAAAKKANKKPKKKNQEKRQERKAAKTLSAILLAFILTWTPYNVLTLLKALAPCDKDDCFSSELWNFSYYLCYINSTINPVCYALCNASFRRTYVRILTCKWHSRTKTAVQRGVYNWCWPQDALYLWTWRSSIASGIAFRINSSSIISKIRQKKKENESQSLLDNQCPPLCLSFCRCVCSTPSHVALVLLLSSYQG